MVFRRSPSVENFVSATRLFFLLRSSRASSINKSAPSCNWTVCGFGKSVLSVSLSLCGVLSVFCRTRYSWFMLQGVGNNTEKRIFHLCTAWNESDSPTVLPEFSYTKKSLRTLILHSRRHSEKCHKVEEAVPDSSICLHQKYQNVW